MAAVEVVAEVVAVEVKGVAAAEVVHIMPAAVGTMAGITAAEIAVLEITPAEITMLAITTMPRTTTITIIITMANPALGALAASAVLGAWAASAALAARAALVARAASPVAEPL